MNAMDQQSVVTGLCGRQVEVADCDNCTIIPLTDLKCGQTARLMGFQNEEDMTVCRRLFDLGFRVGTDIEMVRKAPIGGPITYRVSGAELLLRSSEAQRIMVSVA